MGNEVKIMLYENKAVAEFSQQTAPELKEKIRELSWLKWGKKELGEKTYWKLNIDLSDTQDNLNTFIALMFDHKIEVLIKDSKDSDWRKIENTDNTPTTEKAEPYPVYLKPSYHAELMKVAEEKHISFSTLVQIALDGYLNARTPIVVDSYAEKVRVEMAKRQTKAAYVARDLNIPESTFNNKLNANRFTEDEKKKIDRYFGW